MKDWLPLNNNIKKRSFSPFAPVLWLRYAVNSLLMHTLHFQNLAITSCHSPVCFLPSLLSPPPLKKTVHECFIFSFLRFYRCWFAIRASTILLLIAAFDHQAIIDRLSLSPTPYAKFFRSYRILTMRLIEETNSPKIAAFTFFYFII